MGFKKLDLMTELTQLRETAHIDLTRLFQQASVVSSGVVLLIGTIVLLGWQLDIPLMVGSFTVDLAPMGIRSAIAFVIAGLSLGCLRWRSSHPITLWVGQTLAIAVIILGLLSLGETSLHRPIDQWLTQSLLHSHSWIAPGWIPLSTGLNFVLVGNALLLSSRRERWLCRMAQLLNLFAALVAVNALLTNVHPIGLLPSDPHPPMAMLTALTFLILGAGIQALHLDEAIMQIARITDGSSEGMVCQLLLAAIALAVIEAFVTLWEQPQMTGEVVFDLSLLTIKTVLIFTLLIGWSISLLTRIRQDYQQAEAVVDESLNWLQMAQDAACLGRWEWDVISNQMRWCLRQEQLFGFVPGNFGRTCAAFLECVHPDDRESVAQVLAQAVKTHQDYFDQFRVVWADGSVHWILSKGHCFRNDAGRVIGINGVSLDVTEHQEIQEQRNQLLHLEQSARAKAEAANRMKDEFLSILSHEVRTPLNSVLGWIQLLRSRSLTPMMAEKGLEALSRNAQAQAQIIEDLLDMAQIVQGKIRLDLQPTNLGTVIEAAIEIVRPAAKTKQIQIFTCLNENPMVLGDAERLQQIVWNLLSNAVKFTSPEGTIDVTLRQTDTEIHLQVSDTGRGINPEFLPYVFDRFWQEDSTLTRKYGGLGLGLALVRYLVELHGGTVEVASEGIGSGATFIVKLPRPIDCDSPAL